MRLAVQEDMLDGSSVEERFNAAEELGLDGIELWSTGLAERLDKARGLSRLMGIRVAAVHVATRASLVAAEHDEQRFAAAELRRLLPLCAKLGAVGLIYTPGLGGPRNAQATDVEQVRSASYQILRDRLAELGQAAAAEGTRLLLAPVNRFESYLLNSLSDAEEICERAGGEGLGVCANLYHQRLEGGSGAPGREAGAGLAYVQVSDSGRTLPGRGSANLAAEINTLRQAGYDGFLAIDAGIPGQNSALRRFFARELPPAIERMRALISG